jgi:hypothetical protein
MPHHLLVITHGRTSVEGSQIKVLIKHGAMIKV